MGTPDRILKQDAAGRVWTPPEQREAILDEFERSGLPATKFAAHVGVKYQTFVVWVRRRRQERSRGGSQPPALPCLAGWVEATVESEMSAPVHALTVHLPGGVRLEVTNAVQAKLAACLLRALGEGASAC